MRLLVWPLIVILLSACAAPGDDKPVAEQTAEQLSTDLTGKHPSAYFHLAEALFAEGEKARAAMMFYVGQIRYRAYLNTLPLAEAAAEEAQYEEFKAGIGKEINQYAARNLDNWVEILDKAVQWHQQHANEFLPKEDYSLLYELTLHNFNELRDYIVENKAFIRATRAEQGLPNEY